MNTRFDILNFFYGLGAAIVLVAALFKFTGMPYANEAFIVGIAVEAAVFLVSSFAYRKKEYQWENVFPHLIGGKENIQSTGNDLQSMSEHLNELNATLKELQQATKGLSEGVKNAQNEFSSITDESKDYQRELSALKSKLAAANKHLSDFDQFNV